MWVSKIERLIAWLLVSSDIFLEHVMLGGVYWRNGVSRTASITGGIDAVVQQGLGCTLLMMDARSLVALSGRIAASTVGALARSMLQSICSIWVDGRIRW
jgi:hypothetical protein